MVNLSGSSAKRAERSSRGGLFRHVLDVQLSLAPAADAELRGSAAAQGMASAASYFLLAICIRCALEGSIRALESPFWQAGSGPPSRVPPW